MHDDEFDRIVAHNADDFHQFALQGLRRSRTKMLVWPALLVLGAMVVVAVVYGVKTWKP